MREDTPPVIASLIAAPECGLCPGPGSGTKLIFMNETELVIIPGPAQSSAPVTFVSVGSLVTGGSGGAGATNEMSH